jgi:putative tryptophan/tyrosine transport system substrate-binding protein
MNRRDALALFVCATASVARARAQPVRTYRILWLSTESQPDPFIDGFREGLRTQGLIEGQHVLLELRYAPGNPAGLQPVLAEPARGPFDLLVSSGPAIRSTRLTRDQTVLFAISGDPVELGIAKSLARPGGNFTGATFLSLDLTAKRVELFKELLPDLRKLAVLSNTDHPGEGSEWRATQAAAASLGLELAYAPFVGGEIDRGLAAISEAKADGMLVFPDGVTMAQRAKIAAFALTRRLPSMFGWSEYCEAGGLMCYGANQRETYVRLAGYAARLLRGEKAADLPIEQPSRFELVVNLNAAKALDLALSPTFLARADKVIE